MYLGAGLYGQANAPLPKKGPKKERQKVLPGRVTQPPPKPPPPRPAPPRPPLQGAGSEIAMPPRTLSMAATERAARERERERPQSATRSRSQGALPFPAFGSSAPARASGSAPASCRSALPAPGQGQAVAPPSNCDVREKQRMEAREERRRARAARDAIESELGGGPRGLSYTASAPELRGRRPPQAPSQLQPSHEDMEKQKMRLACKMEILGFYDGYRGALGKMTANQNKKLKERLSSGSDEAVVEAVQQFNHERQSQLQEWEAKAEGQQNVHRRLRLINEFCEDSFQM